jgi:hypothetical protein
MAGSGTNGTGTVGSNDGVARRVWTARGGGGRSRPGAGLGGTVAVRLRGRPGEASPGGAGLAWTGCNTQICKPW